MFVTVSKLTCAILPLTTTFISTTTASFAFIARSKLPVYGIGDPADLTITTWTGADCTKNSSDTSTLNNITYIDPMYVTNYTNASVRSYSLSRPLRSNEVLDFFTMPVKMMDKGDPCAVHWNNASALGIASGNYTGDLRNCNTVPHEKTVDCWRLWQDAVVGFSVPTKSSS